MDIKKLAVVFILSAFCLYGAATFAAKGWYYIKVIRTVERIMRSNNVRFEF